MDTFAEPGSLLLAAAVILMVKYRRRMAGRASLLAVSGAAGRGAVVVGFVVGCAGAWVQGASFIDMVVLGLSLAPLAGAAAELVARGGARRM
ncbi:hypothetical protein [Streptomyces sp. AM6-12]|uniref:hypothetical protein n=1 Tax=Streptomyces sp. AM6-12 TaxID=3345149 RepID=UPI0037B4152C